MRWLIVSVALSVALTILLNLALRTIPDAADRATRRLTELTSPKVDGIRENGRRVRVFVPWKAMLLLSLILTIVLNLVLRIA